MNELKLIIDSVINYLEQGNQDLYAEAVKQQAQEIERLNGVIESARVQFNLAMDAGEWVDEVYVYKEKELDALEDILEQGQRQCIK